MTGYLAQIQSKIEAFALNGIRQMQLQNTNFICCIFDRIEDFDSGQIIVTDFVMLILETVIFVIGS